MLRSTSLLLIAAAATVFGQDQPPSGGWRRADARPPAPVMAQQSDAYGQPLGQDRQSQDRQAPPVQNDRPFQNDRPAPPMQNDRPVFNLPSELTLRPGTYVTVRINQMLSSDHNQPGDTFSASLAQPVVVDGVVVAQRGQNLYGRIAEAEKAHGGHSSRLGLELTGLTLVDGTQTSVRSQLVARQGSTTPAGQQAGTIATTTVVGAAVGAAADYGRGAAIGAGIGAAAGVAGVLLTRNHPTVVYPETVLTFAIESPVTISTARAPLAFRYVESGEYDRPMQTHIEPRPRERVIYGGYGGGWYGPGYYPYYWGPGISLVFGGGYYRGGFYGRGTYRRWR